MGADPLITDTRFITVASITEFIHKEWEKVSSTYVRRPPVHQDYALMKVLSRLRRKTSSARYRIQLFQRDEKTITPIDFSKLEDSDLIFIVAHGDHNGIYAMGPKAEDGADHLIKLLTGDGNLKTKRAGKDIKMLLLSCRAGLNLHKVVAQKLFVALGRDLKVGGAIGFTFGSIRTADLALTEVLIKGIPWFMEYPRSITEADAEKETSKREGREIKYKDKETEIEVFKQKKTLIEKGFKEVIGRLKSTEVNDSLDELERDMNLRNRWWALMEMQYGLYQTAKKLSRLEFDMWHYPPHDGYAWVQGSTQTAAKVKAILATDLKLVDVEAASIK